MLFRGRGARNGLWGSPVSGVKMGDGISLFFLYNVNAVAKAPPGMAAEPAAEMQEERLKNMPDGFFSIRICAELSQIPLSQRRTGGSACGPQQCFGMEVKMKNCKISGSFLCLLRNLIIFL